MITKKEIKAVIADLSETALAIADMPAVLHHEQRKKNQALSLLHNLKRKFQDKLKEVENAGY